MALPGTMPGLIPLPPTPGDTWSAQQTWPAFAYLAPRSFAFQSLVRALQHTTGVF